MALNWVKATGTIKHVPLSLNSLVTLSVPSSSACKLMGALMLGMLTKSYTLTPTPEMGKYTHA